MLRRKANGERTMYIQSIIILVSKTAINRRITVEAIMANMIPRAILKRPFVCVIACWCSTEFESNDSHWLAPSREAIPPSFIPFAKLCIRT